MLSFDMKEFEARAKAAAGHVDQVQFALANAMTNAAFKTREALINETWAQSVEVRNKRFIANALKIEKATKKKLQATIYDSLGRGHLKLHAKGGVKVARKRLAIPPKGTVKRTAKGIRKSQTPRAIIDNTPKRALRITERGIFVGSKGRLNMKFAFTPSARQPADVPFYEEFGRYMARETRAAFPGAMKRAMKTRRAR